MHEKSSVVNKVIVTTTANLTSNNLIFTFVTGDAIMTVCLLFR